MSDKPLLTDEQMRKLQQLCDEATPGPWEWLETSESSGGLCENKHDFDAQASRLNDPERSLSLMGGGPRMTVDERGYPTAVNDDCYPVVWSVQSPNGAPEGADAMFVSAARIGLPAALAEIRRLRALLANKEGRK